MPELVNFYDKNRKKIILTGGEVSLSKYIELKDVEKTYVNWGSRNKSCRWS